MKSEKKYLNIWLLVKEIDFIEDYSNQHGDNKQAFIRDAVRSKINKIKRDNDK